MWHQQRHRSDPVDLTNWRQVRYNLFTSINFQLFIHEFLTAAVGDDDGLVVKRVVRFRNSLIRAAGRRVDFGRTFHVERFVRALVVELLDEGIELGLLLKQIGACGPSGFFLERQVHAFMTAVLLGMTGADSFDADP